MPDSKKTLAARDSTSNDPTSNKEERGESLREPSPLSKESLEKGEHDSHEPNDADEDASKESESKGGVGVYFRVFKYTDGFDRLLYAISCFGAIVSGASLPLMTLVFGASTRTFSNYSMGNSDPQAFQNEVNRLVLYFVYLFVGRCVINYIGTLCVCIAATRTTNSLRKAFLDSLVRKEIAHFDIADNGSTAAQVATNGNRINQGIAEKLYTFVNGISLFFSAYIVALTVQWKLALITMSVIPAIAVSVAGVIKFDAPIEARIVKIYSRAATVAQDALWSIKTIHAFGAGPKVIKWYDEYLQAAHQEGKKKSLIFGVLFSNNYFLTLAGNALAFWEGYRLFASGEIPDVGTVFTVVLSVTLGATSILSVLTPISTVTNASSAAVELFAIIDKPSKIDPLASAGMRPEKCTGEIEFRDVAFAYPARPTAKVLRRLNLSVPAGKTTALVGPSGCGKSTIVGLLERWYQPASGHILLDGHDVAELNTNWLRSNVRLVQQESTLFDGTVFDNVAKGLVGEQKTLSREDQAQLIRQACEVADAHGFIEKLPQGYDTELGESAGMLSGGQRQRLSIARSIISDPKILLFDEATSALDPRAERVVQDALNRVSKNKTTLVIAHKLATIKNADSIAVMREGEVVEQGNHAELIEQDGLYAAMVRAQDLGDESQKDQPEHHDNEDHTDSTLRPLASRRETQPAVSSKDLEEGQPDHLTAGTLHYSLFKCVCIMLKENKAMYKWYAPLIFAFVMVGGTYPAQALLFARLLNVFTIRDEEEARSKANLFSLMFFIIALANLVGYFAIGVITNIIGQVLTHRYRREMLERIVSCDQDFFDYPENSSNALASKLSSVPSAVQELMSANIGLVVTVIVNVVSTSALGIAIGWKLGLVMVFAGLSVIVGAGFLRVRLDMRLEGSTETQFTKSASLASEAVGAIRTVSSLTLEDSVLREYSQLLDSIVAQVIRSLVPTLIPYSFSQSADFLVMGLGFWYGCRLIASGEYTVTQFFTIFLALVFGGQAAAQFFTYTTSFTKGAFGANYMLWLRTIQPKIRVSEENKTKGPPGDDAPIALDRVEFAYRQRGSAKVLRDVSVKIEPGSYAALVGASGCGKSTVISLLERFYDPTSGRITLSDEDISFMSPALYRQHLSLVPQEAPLYLGSVRQNIALGLDYDPSEEEVREACQQANALEFVSSLPEGLNTHCGSRGLQFSGGQRQRIAVARALIRKPRILLLDEATSALDTQSERIVQEALNKAASTRTTIAIAHRLSTIKHADLILVMEGGKIVERGTHRELQQLNGRYQAMCVAQSLDA
ncbi:hypothetical protein H2199_008593 [Coniosporium tulheliwenetii]|uniref:Uncharacterized protein n=1 Tax=Coniosporium tulheliwenetii TaxID=3383036 RepID=A0ACC2YID1_9PEZI|nr:hypothetical protein H2199_008593 [Cladosporium sp. JES 115]